MRKSAWNVTLSSCANSITCTSVNNDISFLPKGDYKKKLNWMVTKRDH